MASLEGVSLPMYTTLRRTTALFTMLSESIFSAKKHSFKVGLAVGVMIVGALIAGAHDFSFSVRGYALVLCCNISTAVYLTMIGSYALHTGLNSFGLMWCNGILCTPALTAILLLNGELVQVAHFEYVTAAAFQAVLFTSCMLAFFLNYAIFLNTTVNSALTQTVCGNLKDILVIVAGFTVFNAQQPNFLNLLGILVGLSGSFLYALVKLEGIPKVKRSAG
eukprot:CAMPEP_0183794430 /NCGR_PEP_ID=MMETSP0803_2-20130417/3831_1 /TAXON_ID=195967 /ORGANISM="Crustomastix stigmata, Strain CCMP3273" /LENGTH=220 /DNA_ID=CAMNT_0026038833 /DNA_START=592 /DNA_END=1254 /DNA_ORIENTATION=+